MPRMGSVSSCSGDGSAKGATETLAPAHRIAAADAVISALLRDGRVPSVKELEFARISAHELRTRCTNGPKFIGEAWVRRSESFDIPPSDSIDDGGLVGDEAEKEGRWYDGGADRVNPSTDVRVTSSNSLGTPESGDGNSSKTLCSSECTTGDSKIGSGASDTSVTILWSIDRAGVIELVSRYDRGGCGVRRGSHRPRAYALMKAAQS